MPETHTIGSSTDESQTWTADSTIIHAQCTLNDELHNVERRCKSYQAGIEHHRSMLAQTEQSLADEQANAKQIHIALGRLSRTGIANL